MVCFVFLGAMLILILGSKGKKKSDNEILADTHFFATSPKM